MEKTHWSRAFLLKKAGKNCWKCTQKEQQKKTFLTLVFPQNILKSSRFLPINILISPISEKQMILLQCCRDFFSITKSTGLENEWFSTAARFTVLHGAEYVAEERTRYMVFSSNSRLHARSHTCTQYIIEKITRKYSREVFIRVRFCTSWIELWPDLNFRKRFLFCIWSPVCSNYLSSDFLGTAPCCLHLADIIPEKILWESDNISIDLSRRKEVQPHRIHLSSSRQFMWELFNVKRAIKCYWLGRSVNEESAADVTVSCLLQNTFQLGVSIFSGFWYGTLILRLQSSWSFRATRTPNPASVQIHSLNNHN